MLIQILVTRRLKHKVGNMSICPRTSLVTKPSPSVTSIPPDVGRKGKGMLLVTICDALSIPGHNLRR